MVCEKSFAISLEGMYSRDGLKHPELSEFSDDTEKSSIFGQSLSWAGERTMFELVALLTVCRPSLERLTC